MTDLNQLFRKRIGISETAKITFEKLDHILEKTALTIPFENLSIVRGNRYKITKENLIDKILLRNEGGLCYELNPVLFFFLLENGFNVSLVRGVVYNHLAQKWNSTGRTHAAILLSHEEQTYLIDTGFGGNLPLKPVPLNGLIAGSANGEFRIDPVKSDMGNFQLEVKLNNKDIDWRKGYIFDTKNLVKDVSELNEIQQIICEHPESSFNKHSLITRLTLNGNITLTDTSFTQYMNGKARKEFVDKRKFKKLAKEYFSLLI